MKRGDIVEIIMLSHWGGRTPTGVSGVLLRRTYLAYEAPNSAWDVLINGKVVSVRRKQTRVVKDA